MEIVFVILAAVVCILLILVLVKLSGRKADGGDAHLAEELAAEKAKTDLQAQAIQRLQAEKNDLQEKMDGRNADLAAARTLNSELERQIASQKEEFAKMNEKLKAEFQNIATMVTAASTKELSRANTEKLEGILNPFAEKLNDLKQQVSDAYDKESRDKAGLREEIKQLMELNKQMSEDAVDLTRALKGDSKTQGNWGELVLERVLDLAGLEKGVEYDREVAIENGKYRPDVVVHLPDDKHIIVDSKVSLTAYERMVNSDDPQEFQRLQKEHVNSIKKHIDELNAKNYQNLKAFDTPNFVLMFIPVESSFSAAVQIDQSLYNYALQRNVVMVTPSTLLATLRTVASIWQHEKQNRNTLEIARMSGKLYDKLCGFLSDMEKIDKALKSAQSSYNDAVSKLSTGTGNAIITAEKIKKLGAKTTKSISSDYLLTEEGEDQEALPEAKEDEA
ncbi:MAG: DNA recombination protein RmuC [Bacteroidales bacterium]|nr:DNA recombination protein RmuC [Bacteroidales bacterium]